MIGSNEGQAVLKTIVEGHLRFQFDDSWFAIKYDDHRDYRERIERLDGTKAVDFVAVYMNAQLFLIEVKDFRGFRIENRERVTDGQLALEVGQKAARYLCRDRRRSS